MYTYVPISPPLVSPSQPPYPTPLGGHKAWADLPVLCGCFPLAILYLVVYICQCHSLTLSQLSLPPPRVLKSILYVCIFIPILPLGSSEHFFFFRLHIYVLAYGIGFSLSDLLHSVWQTLGPPTSLQITPFHLFYGWVIFYCIYVPHLLYPFICWWTLRLLPCPGYCK